MNGFDESKPIFQQLAQAIEDGIISGAYPEEEQIPSITEYATALKINPATALKGINLLVDRELIYKKRGIGMFVRAGARDRLMQIKRDVFYEARIKPAAREARALGLTIDGLCEMMKRGYNDGH